MNKKGNSFRYVGGTSLSLLMGHRVSVDIDMFTDAEYDSIDFDIIDKLLVDSFEYVIDGFGGNNRIGKSYFLGKNEENAIKIDLFYTDSFILPVLDYESIRISQPGEIVAMKLEVIGHNGRKKDFWDIHELMKYFS